MNRGKILTSPQVIRNPLVILRPAGPTSESSGTPRLALSALLPEGGPERPGCTQNPQALGVLPSVPQPFPARR